MPIDPNIALGVRQPEPINMLGQMGQMMALRAAQQEYEGSEDVRNALSKGERDPYALMQYGKQGRAAAESILKVQKDQRESQKLEAEIIDKTFSNSRHALSMVNSPDSLRAYTLSQFQDPVMGKILQARGLTPDIALANLDKEIATNGFENTYKKSAMGLEKFYQDQTTRRGQDLTYGAAIRGQNLTDTRERQKGQLVDTGQGYVIVDPFKGTSQPVMAPNAPAAPVAAPQPTGGGTGAPTNALAPNQEPSQPQNALVQPQGQLMGKPTAPQLTEIANPDNPMETLRVDVNKYKGGGKDAPGVVGVVKTGNLNPAQQQKVKTEMAKDYKSGENIIAQTNELLKSIDMVKDSDLNSITGQVSSRTPSFSDAATTAETRLNNLKGKVMALGKAASSLSGSIGSIATQEWKILSDQIAAIDPKLGEKALREQIDLIQSQAEGTAARIRDQYQRQYGEHIDLNPQMKEIPNISYKKGGYKGTPAKTPSNVTVSNW